MKQANKMKLELKIIPENEIELLHIAAKLRDIESLVTDSIPFFPNDPSVYSKPEEIGESEHNMFIPSQSEMLEKLNCFAEEKGPDAIKEIFQSYGVSRFSELPKNNWLEVLKLMEQQEPEDEFSSDDIQEEINRPDGEIPVQSEGSLTCLLSNNNWESSCNRLRHGG